jgi:thioredoxin-dependent peroxiredoxin
MTERADAAFEGDQHLTVLGTPLVVGDTAPAFMLDTLDQQGAQEVVSLADSHGAVRLLNIVNSIDTPVCHVETRRWEQIQSALPDTVRVYTVSMDLPYAQARWKDAEQVHHPLLSSHRDETFGFAYGVLIKEWRLLQRAVVVIDGQDRVVHAQYVADQMQEPNYDAAVQAATTAANTLS